MDRRNHLPRGGGNIAVFRNSPLNGGTGAYFRFNDNANAVVMKAFSSMSDIDTGTNETRIQYTFRNSNNSGTTQSWIIVADENTVYVDTGTGTGNFLASFGDAESLSNLDPFKYYVGGGRSTFSDYTSPWFASSLSSGDNQGTTFVGNYNGAGGCQFATASGQLSVAPLYLSGTQPSGVNMLSGYYPVTTSPPPNTNIEITYPAYAGSNFVVYYKFRGMLLSLASMVAVENGFVKTGGFRPGTDAIALKSRWTGSGIWIELGEEWPKSS